MNISFIPREKAESLAPIKPFLLAPIILSSPSSRFLMISETRGLTTIFDLAIINEEDGIDYISSENLRDVINEYLKNSK